MNENTTIKEIFDSVSKEGYEEWLDGEIKERFGNTRDVTNLDKFDQEDLDDFLEQIKEIKIGECIHTFETLKVYTPKYGEYVLVVENDSDVITFYTEYEPMNPFVFGDVVVLSGHDSITLFSLRTREKSRKNIR